MAHNAVEEFHVEHTTPQGTQADGVEFGHENRDVKLRALLAWFTGLVVMMIVVFVAMWGLFAGLAAYQSGHDVMPTPMYTAGQHIPPGQPQVLPNLDQKPNGPHLPWEVGQAERNRENRQLVGMGLSRETGGEAEQTMVSTGAKGEAKMPEDGSFMPDLPPDAVTMVAAEQPKGAAAASPTPALSPMVLPSGVRSEQPDVDRMPSQSSGGLRVEGRQR